MVGVREGRGRDDLTDEIAKKRKRRRASTHTKQCSPKAKAPRCRRMAKHEKSKPRNVYYCVFFASQVFPSRSLLFAGQASERRFPLTENGIEWTALSPRHSFPELCFCYLYLTAVSVERFQEQFGRVLTGVRVVFFQIFFCRELGEEKTITSSSTQYIVFSVALRFYFPQPHHYHQDTVPNTQHAGGVFFHYYVSHHDYTVAVALSFNLIILWVLSRL